MTAPAHEDLPVGDHDLTTQVIAKADGTYRVVATCSCLHFGRSATTTTSPVADYGRLLVADMHAAHVRRCQLGLGYVETRPTWLPPLPGPSHQP